MSMLNATIVDVLPEAHRGRPPLSSMYRPYLDGQVWRLTFPSPEEVDRAEKNIRNLVHRLKSATVKMRRTTETESDGVVYALYVQSASPMA